MKIQDLNLTLLLHELVQARHAAIDGVDADDFLISIQKSLGEILADIVIDEYDAFFVSVNSARQALYKVQDAQYALELLTKLVEESSGKPDLRANALNTIRAKQKQLQQLSQLLSQACTDPRNRFARYIARFQQFQEPEDEQFHSLSPKVIQNAHAFMDKLPDAYLCALWMEDVLPEVSNEIQLYWKSEENLLMRSLSVRIDEQNLVATFNDGNQIQQFRCVFNHLSTLPPELLDWLSRVVISE